MGEAEESEVAAEGQRYTLGRLVQVCDGVFAFSLTLLVVFLVIPDLPAGHTSGQLAHALSDQGTAFLSYGLSFFTIYVTWNGHQRMFKHIRRSDARFVQLNFALLLFVALLPFPTAVLGRYDSDPLAAVLYALFVAVIGLLMVSIWWYATGRRRLVAAGLDERFIRTQRLSMLRSPAIFLASIPVALWQPHVAEAAWITAGILLSVLRTPEPRSARGRPASAS